LKRTKKLPSVAETEEPEEDEVAEDQEPQSLRDSPVDSDDAVPGTSGETTVRQAETPDDLDDMINGILEG
jgi:hypothetical protein